MIATLLLMCIAGIFCNASVDGPLGPKVLSLSKLCPPESVTFIDSEGGSVESKEHVSGLLKIAGAFTEDGIDDYKVYFGDFNQTQIGTVEWSVVAVDEKRNKQYSVVVAPTLTIPENAVFFMVASTSKYGKSAFASTMIYRIPDVAKEVTPAKLQGALAVPVGVENWTLDAGSSISDPKKKEDLLLPGKFLERRALTTARTLFEGPNAPEEGLDVHNGYKPTKNAEATTDDDLPPKPPKQKFLPRKVKSNDKKTTDDQTHKDNEEKCELFTFESFITLFVWELIIIFMLYLLARNNFFSALTDALARVAYCDREGEVEEAYQRWKPTIDAALARERARKARRKEQREYDDTWGPYQEMHEVL
eukprot:Platyproteum_vivax@DN7407_c1_g1_i12.p1